MSLASQKPGAAPLFGQGAAQKQKVDKKKHVLRLETNCTPYFLEDQVNCLNLKKLREMKMLSNWLFREDFPIVSKYKNYFLKHSEYYTKISYLLINALGLPIHDILINK